MPGSREKERSRSPRCATSDYTDVELSHIPSEWEARSMVCTMRAIFLRCENGRTEGDFFLEISAFTEPTKETLHDLSLKSVQSRLGCPARERHTRSHIMEVQE